LRVTVGEDGFGKLEKKVAHSALELATYISKWFRCMYEVFREFMFSIDE
jgi:hypothetical protein